MAIRHLSAYTIAEIYTLEQIDAKIATLSTSLENATAGGYSFDSGQHRQTITAPTASLDSIESLLAVYMKARSIKAGTHEGTRLISGGYAP